MSLWGELRRRHVFRIAAVYAATGWLVLQLGAIVFPALHVPGWALPLLIGFVALGFPVALVLAWAFELSPEGVRRSEPADSAAARPAEHARRVGRVLNAAIIAALSLAVAILLWRQFGGLPAGSGPGSAATAGVSASLAVPASAAIPAKSIAVLPFANDSGNQSDRYFSDGLSEDLIIALSQYPGLKVIGRESSFHFRGSDLDGRVIGQRLGVAHLLEGSVSRVGDEVRIRAELVNAADGSTLWSEHYDRPYKDLFALQDAITKAVADALEARLDLTGGAVAQSDRPPSGSLKAYNAYLEGNFYADRFSEKDFRTAIGYYRRAVALDSQYAAAYAALAHASGYLGAAFLGGDEMRREYADARAAADKSLALDPNLAAGYRARGVVLRFAMDWTRSVEAFRRALQLAPGSPQAQSDLANALATLGELAQAVALQRKSLAANPLDAHGYYRLALMLTGLGRLVEARKAIDHAIALQPTGPYHYALGLIEALLGHPEAAVTAAKKEGNSNWKGFGLAIALAAGNDHKGADAALRSYIHDYADLAAYQIADIYAFRRQPDEAFAWLESAWKKHDPGFGTFLMDPFLKPYRSDPRFTAICREVGLPLPGD